MLRKVAKERIILKENFWKEDLSEKRASVKVPGPAKDVAVKAGQIVDYLDDDPNSLYCSND